VHRDLSPQNGTYTGGHGCSCLVLYQQGNWKIADFGLTSEATSNRLVTTSARGKPCYRVPELLRDTSGYNNKADIWALGCIGYELFTGRKAFRNDYHVFGYASARRPPKKLVNQLIDVGKYYIQDLHELDPIKRPSAKTLLKTKFRAEWQTPTPTAPPEPVPVICQSKNFVARPTLRWSEPVTPKKFRGSM
jgi:serine/threonine protein kinase